MAEKKSFLLYIDTLDIAMEHLNDVELAELFKMIYAYQKGQDFEPTHSSVKMIFSFFKNGFDRDKAKYEEVSQRRRDAVNKRWEKRSAETIQEIQNVQLNTNVPIMIDDNDTETDNDIKEVKKKVSAHHADYDWISPEFYLIFKDFLDYKRREQKGTYKTEATVRAAYNNLIKMSNGDAFIARQIVDQTIANGYMGLVPLKNNQGNGTTTQFERNAQSQQQLACDLTEYYRQKRERERLADGQG